jgi:Ca2+-binding RTX toxin-like protein
MSSRRRVLGVVSIACGLVAALLLPAPAGAARRPRCFGERATIVGTSGADRIRGTRGRDVIVGRAGNDTILGRGGNDLICGGKGNDAISGGRGNDRIAGGAGADLLVGGPGSDRLVGKAGFDALQGGPGKDFLDGSGQSAPPFDLGIYTDASGPVTIDVPNGTASGAGIGTDTFVRVEDFDGSDFDDTMIGGDDATGDGFFGLGGNDTIAGNGGLDFIQGGLGDDDMDGGAGFDSVDFNLSDQVAPVDADLLQGVATGQGTDALVGFEAVVGTMGADTLTLSNADGEAAGLAGDDTLIGGSGDDFLSPGGGDDTTTGGDGDDILDHYSWEFFWVPFLNLQASSVTVDMNVGTATGQGNDTFSGIELVTGTPSDDTLTGSSAADILLGFDGDDSLNGGAGDDLLDADCLVAFGEACPFGDGANDVTDGGDGQDICVAAETVSNCESDVLPGLQASSAQARARAAWRATWDGAQARLRGLRSEHPRYVL